MNEVGVSSCEQSVNEVQASWLPWYEVGVALASFPDRAFSLPTRPGNEARVASLGMRSSLGTRSSLMSSGNEE